MYTQRQLGYRRVTTARGHDALYMFSLFESAEQPVPAVPGCRRYAGEGVCLGTLPPSSCSTARLWPSQSLRTADTPTATACAAGVRAAFVAGAVPSSSRRPKQQMRRKRGRRCAFLLSMTHGLGLDAAELGAASAHGVAGKMAEMDNHSITRTWSSSKRSNSVVYK
jgi:hypothetical protein